MNIARLKLFTLAMAGCAILLGTQGLADETQDEVKFAAPRRIKAGDAYVGEGLLYPSPVLHDANGDKRLDIVVGDLRGMVTVAHRTSAANSPVKFAASQPFLDRQGQQLKFHNW